MQLARSFCARTSSFGLLLEKSTSPHFQTDSMRSDAIGYGSARVPRATDGVAPSVSFHPIFAPSGERSLWDEVCGATPQTARRRRTLPKFNCMGTYRA